MGGKGEMAVKGAMGGKGEMAVKGEADSEGSHGGKERWQ